ncbi:MAG: hypothetical protein LW817_00190, partial [Candidatus Caenarcaniphilales bacterium]|nr:hypothetical protein [Candidatus Caenarcaniphilales bacterium]
MIKRVLLLFISPKPLSLEEYRSIQRSGEIHKWRGKAHELKKLWAEFQKQFFSDRLTGKSNPRLQYFCHELIKVFNRRNPSKKIVLNHQNSHDVNQLSRLINTQISQEEQEIIWRDATLKNSLKFNVINEQKHKYGTKAFEHDQMPRIITEKTRAAYKQAIMANQKFQEAGFSFLGMGFGGAAFKVNDSFGKNSIA